MQVVPYIARPIVTARDAIADHVRWKITLLTAVRMRERLSARTTHSIRHPDKSFIRQWLHAAYSRHLRQTCEYSEVLVCHTQFHREMQAISSLIQSRQFEAAERLLTTPGSFEKASLAVANAIMALERIPARSLAS